MVTRCLCDFCMRVMKQGKYLFANFVEISVEGEYRLLFLALTVWTFLLAFLLCVQSVP